MIDTVLVTDDNTNIILYLYLILYFVIQAYHLPAVNSAYLQSTLNMI